MPHRHGAHHVHRRFSEDAIPPEPLFEPEPDSTIDEPASLVRRATSTSTCTSSSCETSTSSNLVNTLPVVLGVVIPVVVAIVVLLFLHRRHVRKLRQEDSNDKHKSLDFGMEAVGGGGGGGGRGNPEMGEKPHKHGMSLDLMSNPYLLPPGLQNSKESLRSLSKVVSPDDDKYRLAAQSDSASMRSFPSHPKWGQDDASSFGGSTRNMPAPVPHDDMNQSLLQNASRMSRSPPVDDHQAMHEKHLHEQNMIGESIAHSNEDLPRSDDFPKPAVSNTNNELFLGSFGEQNPQRPNEASHNPDPNLGGFDFGAGSSIPTNEHHDAPAMQETLAEPHSEMHPTPRLSLPMSESSDYGDEPKSTLPPSFNISEAEDHHPPPPPEPEEPSHPPENRMTQQFTNFDEGFDPHRLTVGIRPLPPEDPTDNAEQRANRIRSFYKEYFDDSKGGNEEYYEDYGAEFYEDAAVYDPYSGDYYMGGPPKPFAQPVARRAMTPPPRFQEGPRPMMHSAAGMRAPGPRAFSSASARLPVKGPRKPPPPPEPLHVLPSPHLLKDDMSILPIDYAPGKTIRDRAEGRPDSPRGGLRPFTPSRGRPHTPLVSAFDDLAAIPSPHALRKSGLYTSLDFAPIPKLRHETGSDAGSIRSARTGISAVHSNNVRNGAYRVSRLPTDVVGTKDDIMTSLRPNMDLGR